MDNVIVRSHHVSMKLNEKFQMLLSSDERAAFSDAAERAGLRLSAWIRQVCRERSGMNHAGTEHRVDQ